METLYHLSDYKFIVFDIDGTLVGADHILHPFTKEVLLSLHDHGLPFTLATGKTLPATKAQADELLIREPLILSNGSVLQRRTGEILFHTFLPAAVTERVVEICEDLGEDLVIYKDDRIYIKRMNENIYPIYSIVKFGLFEIGEWSNLPGGAQQTTKCLIVNRRNSQNLFNLEGIFREHFDGQADIVHTSRVLLEVLPGGVSKATGVRRLADEMGIQMSEVMAFGDYDNDTPMLAAAGLGIAVQNASDSAKKAADLVIGPCEENAPAKFLKGLLEAAR